MTRAALVGVSGFGIHHVANLRRLRDLGRLELVAYIDPLVKAKLEADPSFDAPQDAPIFNSIDEAIESIGKLDVIVISVPIHLHARIAKQALLAGADVLLEKPPFATMQDFQDLLEVEAQTGRLVQVGFQSLGSQVVPAIPNLGLGKIKAVRAMGNWLRAKKYWDRSPWVGKRSMGGVHVMDGVATNALSHSVITALHIAGIYTAEEVDQVELEMYRCNPTDVDDTTSLRITSKGKPIVSAALTLCATEQVQPRVEIVGENHTATFYYGIDELSIDGSEIVKYDRVNLLENLLDHREKGTPLRVPLKSTGSFMKVMDAIRNGGEPVHVERKWVQWDMEGEERHPVLHEVEKWVRAAADINGLFSEADAPWAFAKRDKAIGEARLEGKPIFSIIDGYGTNPTSSPRPYIHPVHTLSGIEVTATRPADHDWHLGLGFAVPDVNGISFWGGGTFIKGRGYVMLDNHGSMVTKDLQIGSNKLEHTLDWLDLKGQGIIRETRCLSWEALPQGTPGWKLSYTTKLTALIDISLGSPGTNGRENAGYGGFFWRLPRCTDVDVLSAEQDGEDNVHGHASQWIGWSGKFEARPETTGEATLVFTPADDASAKDPWVVRYSSYPGIGSAVAWETRVEIPKGENISRSFVIAIVDGRLDRAKMAAIAQILQKQ